MKVTCQDLEHARVRAPGENGGTLVVPPLELVGKALECNRATLAGYDYDVQGRSLAQLMREARAELALAAWNYTRGYRDVPRPTVEPDTRMFLAGHQPQVFHPGVWFKNFVLGAIAQQHGGLAINLAIDSDTIKTAALRIPTGSPQAPTVESVPFDRQSAEIPYEARHIVDAECLASFGSRAADTIAPLVADPFVRQFWPLVQKRAAECTNLGECIAQARHQQEGAWGLSTLEIPQSRVCELTSFHWFASHLLARLPVVWEHYNRAVAEYRRANHIRSTAHPVPDLAMEDDWLEAPFWVWSDADPRRRRLFARQRGDEIVLADRHSFEFALALTPEGDASRAVEQLAELAQRGVRLRTRALATTLFARLFLGDMFLHGIGGAKYDQVTDAIIEQLFGLQAPLYMTVTATLRLPIAGATDDHLDARDVDRRLRELVYHPERFLPTDGAAAVAKLVGEKRQGIETPPTPENAKQRGDRIRAANQGLQAYLEAQRAQLLEERSQAESSQHTRTILGSREYAFCLYPEAQLRQLMSVPAAGV